MSRAPAAFLAVAFCAGLVLEDITGISIGTAAGVFGAALVAAVVACVLFSARPAIVHGALFFASVLSGVLRYALLQIESPDAIQRFARSDQSVIVAGEVISAQLKGRPQKGKPLEREAKESKLPDAGLLQGKFLPKKLLPRWEQQPDTLWRCMLSARAVYLAAEKRWHPAVGLVFASGTQLAGLRPGDKVLLAGQLGIADGERNPGDFNYREYLAAQGISAVLRCRDAAIVWRQAATHIGWRELLQRVRDYTWQQIHWFAPRSGRSARGDAAGLIGGLLLGEREEISEEIREAFARTGLIHILAVSGLHVGFVLLIVLGFGDVLRLPPLLKALLAGAALVFFAALTGFHAPVVRAMIMALVFIGGRLCERGGNSYNTVALAALIILLDEPRQLFQIGFQLSFAAVLGIGYFYEPIVGLLRRLLPWRRQRRVSAALNQGREWFLGLLAVSLAAQLATAPIIAHAFGRVPALAIWGNLLIIPLAFWLVASATVACAITPLWRFAGEVFGSAADLAARMMLGFTRWLADTPGAYIDGVLFTIPAIVLFILAAATIVEWRSPRRRILLPLCLLLVNILVWRTALSTPVKMRATFFDIGQGDAALIEFTDGKKLLIDAGPRHPGFDAGSRTVVPFLRRQGIRHLDALIVTHPHNDHIGGVPAVLRGVTVDTVYGCGVDGEIGELNELEHVADSLRVPRIALKAGRRLRQFVTAELVVLHPSARATAPSLNEASVVVRMICGRVSFFFSGDAERWAESHMAKYGAVLDSDLLKVGHHGSRTSSSPQFISRISPAWAVVSVGKRNRFGHPSAEVIDRLKISGAQVVRLDENGAAIFCTDGRRLWRER